MIHRAIGMIELTSVGIGYLVQDAMLKAADVELILGRTICSGKYINLVGGAIASVQASVEAGLQAAPDGVIDHVTVPNVHESVFPALGQSVQLTVSDKKNGTPDALGIVESYSASVILEAADAAAKAAHVTLFRIHMAMALGGKAFMLMAGSVASCEAGVAAAREVVVDKGLLVSALTIARPSRELMAEYI
ncbi:MAG: BMC domain-containing protein [Phycisphaeraceae bacterium]|nr:BMC domain-containing protein [Phycisphaeraceae bacterium]